MITDYNPMSTLFLCVYNEGNTCFVWNNTPQTLNTMAQSNICKAQSNELGGVELMRSVNELSCQCIVRSRPSSIAVVIAFVAVVVAFVGCCSCCWWW